MTVELKAPDL